VLLLSGGGGRRIAPLHYRVPATRQTKWGLLGARSPAVQAHIRDAARNSSTIISNLGNYIATLPAESARLQPTWSDRMVLMHTESSTELPSTGLDTSTWVVIPLYNEASVIADVVSELKTTFTHVVCVDDGSADASAAVARAAGARVLSHPLNLGQGAALQTAISYATAQSSCEHVITFDADGQHRLVDAIEMLRRARKEDLDVVFGSRFLDKRTDPGFAKRVVLKTAVGVTNLTTGLRLTDAHNGLRVLSVEAASRLHLQQDRMAHATEIVLQLGRTKLPWAESPVEVLYTDYSKAKGQSLLNSINILFDLVMN
jgi:hypothetical protein